MVLQLTGLDDAFSMSCYFRTLDLIWPNKKGDTRTPIFDTDQPLYTGFYKMGYRLDGYTTQNWGMFEATCLYQNNSNFAIVY
jgi:hypothetical protein